MHCECNKDTSYHRWNITGNCTYNNPLCSYDHRMLAGASQNDIHFQKQLFQSNLNPLTAKLFNLKFHPLEVVSRWRDPQLQVSENYSDLTKWRSTVFKYC